jgi:hypothetical protein
MTASIISQSEAARAVFASIVFASRFHQGIAPLSEIAERGLDADRESHQTGRTPCQ